MDIRMKQAESLYLESTMKSAETREDKKADKTASAASASGTETVTKTVELDWTTGLTSVEKAGKAAEVRQPSYDEFIPEKTEEAKSFGHYQPVSDGKGGVEIQFDAPAENTDKTESRDGEAEKLKRKLAQVKRELSASGK